jgi:alkyl sulfatase BDS1-like metallo-beta-lactamase superfamily hydrolase
VARTREIDAIEETLTIDCVAPTFQFTPGVEAPAEIKVYLPQFGVLEIAENANVTMRQVLSPRGVNVRDAKFRVDQLTRSISLPGSKSEAVIVSHGGRDLVRRSWSIASRRTATPTISCTTRPCGY